jgi:hypothetical protein
MEQRLGVRLAAAAGVLEQKPAPPRRFPQGRLDFLKLGCILLGNDGTRHRERA